MSEQVVHTRSTCKHADIACIACVCGDAGSVASRAKPAMFLLSQLYLTKHMISQIHDFLVVIHMLRLRFKTGLVLSHG